MFTFARFATLLKEYTIMTNEDIVNLLLGCIYKTQGIKNKKGDPFYFNKVECSRLINGEKDIVEEIVRGAGEEGICEQAEDYFGEFVCPNILSSRILDLIDELSREIKKDYTIAPTKRNRLLELADEEKLAQFLAEVCLYVITKPNKGSAPVGKEHNANQDYVDGYVKTLFLHTNRNAKVTLENLYIWQDYSEENSERKANLEQRLADFIGHPNDKLLIIEGIAGTGKSTLVQCLNYHYLLKDKEIFGNRHLVTVRLRDFDNEMRSLVADRNNLLNGLMKYLRRTKTELEESFQDSVYILDGLDELCTSDSGIHGVGIIYELMRQLPYKAKMMITTRPNYIGTNRLNHLRMISLCPYSFTQRNEWIRKYEDKKICGEEIPEYLHTYLDKIEKEDSIFNVPLNLYMLVARRPDPSKLDNTWTLYHEILYEDIRDTLASKQTANPDIFSEVEHPDAGHWDIYYQICEEIAYEMYVSGNRKLSVHSDDIRMIIGRMKETCQSDRLKEHFFEELEEHCHALCGFWKSNPGSGVFEFFHNDIRDFFLCEKVYREFFSGAEKEPEFMARRMADLFQYGRLERKVLDFLKMRATYYKETNFIDHPDDGNRQSLKKLYFYRSVLQIMVTEDNIYPTGQDANLSEKLGQIALTVKCIWEIYITLNLPFKYEGFSIFLWNEIGYVNKKGFLKYILEQQEKNLYLPYVNFSGANIPNAHLTGADLYNSNLENSNLENADFQNADLRGANLTKADLSHANLRNAKLKEAVLKDAIFNHAELYGVEPEVRKLIQNETEYMFENRNGSVIKQPTDEVYPGDILGFGSYWQEKHTSDGKKPEKTPVLWRVLDVDARSGRALLLADQILDCQPYNTKYMKTSWAECTLRMRLNDSEFYSEKDDERSFLYEAFNEEERRRICEVDVLPDQNPHSEYRETDQGKIVRKQKIFLLSGAEVVKYFGRKETKEDRSWIELGGMQAAALATDFAKERYGERLYVGDERETSLWWLRSVGASASSAMSVNYDGSVGACGYYVHYDSVGVRPALWITLKS